MRIKQTTLVILVIIVFALIISYSIFNKNKPSKINITQNESSINKTNETQPNQTFNQSLNKTGTAGGPITIRGGRMKIVG
jgi:hypothetical protein